VTDAPTSSAGSGVTRLVTRDLDLAHEYIHSVFTPHRLAVRGDRLDFELAYAESSRVTLGHLRYGAEVAVAVPPPEQCYHVVLPLAGACRVGQRRGVVDLTPGERGAVLSPDEPLTVYWEPESVGYVLKVPRVSLEAHLGRLSGVPIDRPVEFALDFDLTTGGAQALTAAVPFLWTELARQGGISGMPLAREHLEYVVLTQLLSVVPHSYSDALHADRPMSSRQRSRVQQVVDIIEAHPEEALSSAHLAAAAGVTERTLQLAFQREFGTSPSAYVRGVRLGRVHSELLSGGGGATVTEIASRWGFLHPSRFAQQYQQRYGCLPSETLSQARAGSS
jgi:AraC-like DNA-binding protein